MSIVKSKNKKTGITYVYESESYWDSEKKQPRNRRKLIGKLDENGEIVPTGNRGRSKKAEETDETTKQQLREELDNVKTRSRRLETEITLLNEEIRKLKHEKMMILKEMGELLQKYKE